MPTTTDPELILDQLHKFRDDLDGDYVAAIEAERFAAQMRTEHPRAWRAWAQSIAVQHLTIELARYERRQRRRALAPERLFGQAAEAADVEALGLFRATFVVDGQNTRRPLGQMTAADCRFAARGYEQLGNRSLLIAAFLGAVAKRLRGRTVEEAFTEQQCQQLLASCSDEGRTPLAA